MSNQVYIRFSKDFTWPGGKITQAGLSYPVKVTNAAAAEEEANDWLRAMTDKHGHPYAGATISTVHELIADRFPA